MRKWTKSACVVIAWCILPVMAAVGSQGAGQSAQAHISIASSAQVTLASAPGTLTTVAAPAAVTPAANWTVRPSTGSAGRTAGSGVMPGWLKDTLLAAGLLTLVAFVAEPAVVLSRRRRRASRAAGPRAAGGQRGRRQRGRSQPGSGQLTAAEAAKKAAKIVQADYERLIVTYSVSDNTVCVLTPPGEDPRAILRAARLVLPEDTYEELAGYLGIPSGWLSE